MKLIFLFLFVLQVSLCFGEGRPKVFGLGLSKTGTTSLSQALELLGYHTLHHDRTLVPFLYEKQNVDWKAKYEAFDAVTDIPTAHYFRELNEAFPDALFILTVRDVDNWYHSFVAHSERMEKRWGGGVPFRIQKLHDMVYGSYQENETLWKQNYVRHNRKVIKTIPKERLLVMNIADRHDGWSKLCPFIGITDGPCSPENIDSPFPRANTMPSEEDESHFNEFHPPCALKKTGSAPKYAYTMLLGDVSLPHNRDYLIASLVLAQSLRNVQSRADIVALIYGNVHEADIEMVEALGIKTLKVFPVGGVISNDPGPFSARIGTIYRTKIRAWQLTQYDRVIFADLDGMFMKNPDHLFQLKNFTGCKGGNSPFNAGFFVLTPNCQALIDMNDMAHSNSFNQQSGWFDYGPFPHWRYEGQSSDWSFYAAQAEQGLIWYYYGLYLKTGVFEETTYFDDLYFHFIGSHKPWLLPPQYLDRANRRYRDPTRIWYQIYQQVKQQLKEIYEAKGKTLPSITLSGQTVEDYGPDPYCNSCKVGPWGNYTNCSVPCGGGLQFRYRNITQQPSCNNTCPPLSQNKTCNPQPCDKFACQKGNCFCLSIANKTLHEPTIQSSPAVPTVNGCGSGYNFTINSTWGWDAVCNQSQICYSTCNGNKTTCDKAFLAGLLAACALLPKGPPQTQCTQTARLFGDTTRANASMNEFIANQTSHCSCPSTLKEAKQWSDRVRDSFDKFLTNFCNSRLSRFETVEECKEKSLALLLEKTKKEEEAHELSKKDKKNKKTHKKEKKH